MAGFGRSLAFAAALAASSAMAMLSPVATLPRPGKIERSQPTTKKRRSPKPKLTPVRWASGMASSYRACRHFHAGRSSTLKKTAKALRLERGL
jgi:hypothetical protein